MKLEVEQETLDCAVRHIDALRNQCLGGKMADFGVVCSDCSHASKCKFSWYTRLQPLIEQSNETIHLGSQLHLNK